MSLLAHHTQYERDSRTQKTGIVIRNYPYSHNGHRTKDDFHRRLAIVRFTYDTHR
jgi:hypothetical protein